MNKLICFFSILALMFLSFKEPDYCQLSDKILFGISKKLKKENGLNLVGHGGAMMDDIQQVSMHYVATKKMSVEEARKLYVGIAEEYLKQYNQDGKIRKHLHDYPFTIKNIDLMIGLENEKKENQSDGSVALIFVAKEDVLFYEAFDPVKDQFYSLHKEPYSKAVEIVKNQK